MIKAIIIDDEERARSVLKKLIEDYCEGVEVVAVCSNIPDSVKEINALNPDVVFCDVVVNLVKFAHLINFTF